jgi:hypothetical protein
MALAVGAREVEVDGFPAELAYGRGSHGEDPCKEGAKRIAERSRRERT